MPDNTEADKRAITEQLYLFCRGVDRGDLALLQSVFHEDALDEHGVWEGKAQDFGPFIVEALKGARTSHMISNVLIELRGDEADCESYCLAVSEEAGTRVFVHSRNVDRFERRSGVWKIAKRQVVFDVARMEPALPPPPFPESAAWGRRDTQDPSYLRPYHAKK